MEIIIFAPKIKKPTFSSGLALDNEFCFRPAPPQPFGVKPQNEYLNELA
jgi:hypothetical protein